MSDTVGVAAVAGPAAGASWAVMAERARSTRGCAIILPPAGLLTALTWFIASWS